MLTELQKSVVKRLAKGDVQLKDEAKIFYHENIKTHFDSGRKSVEMNFLTEVFNASPDLTLKALYREQVLADK